MAPYNTPQAIRPLEKTICDFAYSNGYDPISVFNDFLRYVIHGFSPGAPPLMDWKYKRQQNRHFMEMLTGWIRLMQRELQSGGWFDAFGDLFMAISSKIGRQVNGQFFTPPDICDLMVLCTDSGRQRQENVSVTRHAEAEGYCWHIMYATWVIIWLQKMSTVPVA